MFYDLAAADLLCSIQAGLKSKNFPLIVNEYEPNTYNKVMHRIMQRFPNGGNRLVNIMLSDANEVIEYWLEYMTFKFLSNLHTK